MNPSPRLPFRICIRQSKSTWNPPQCPQRRFLKTSPKLSVTVPQENTPHPLDSENSKHLRLTQDNLFHPLIKSPILKLRQKGMAIKSLAVCPTSGLLEGNEFTCPNCGFPTHCSEEHYKLDQERHERHTCDTLRMINEDLHDIHSGRDFREFTLRGIPITLDEIDLVEKLSAENMLNFTNWDHILFTRSMEMISSERSLRHLTNLLTYPYTIASVLHENSPYHIKNRLTIEGLTSMAGISLCRCMLIIAIRQNALHPAPQGIDRLRETDVNTPTVRIFILGARSESSLPRYFWEQLCFVFHRVPLVLYMIGPEAVVMPNAFQPRADVEPLYVRENYRRPIWRENPNRKMSIETHEEKFQVLHDEELFQPFDPYTDVFFLFSPLFHVNELSSDWVPVIPQLLKTKCSIFVTDSQKGLIQKTVDWVMSRWGGEVDEILQPGLNEFRSLKVEVDLFDLDSFHQKNMYIWGFRGKRYQVQDNWALL